MTEWWNSREPRERVLLMVLAVLAALFLLVFALILPLRGANAASQAKLERAQSDLALVQRVVPRLTAGAAARAPFDRAALIRVSSARNVKLARVQPGDDGSLSVWIDEAQTDALYGLLNDLTTNYTATPERVSLTTDWSGRLSAQFTLRAQ